MSSSAPVGVFDSGVGGLSVVREIRRLLPALDIDYVADARFLPWGDRDEDFVRARSIAIGDFLVGRGARALVIACNTATAAAAREMRAHFAVPVVGIEPAVKPAAAATHSGIVGILATASTLQSRKYAELLERYGSFVRVLGQPCRGLVERVEAGDLDGPATEALLRTCIGPLLAQGADTLVLGCTHYPFLHAAIARVAGPGVRIVDPSEAVARRLASVLGSATRGSGALRVFSSGDVDAHATLMTRLLGHPVTVEPLPF
jgi:glutamate racemase